MDNLENLARPRSVKLTPEKFLNSNIEEFCNSILDAHPLKFLYVNSSEANRIPNGNNITQTVTSENCILKLTNAK